MNEMKEDVIEMKKIVKQAQNEEQSLAMQLLSDMKAANKRMFILFFITLIISSLEFCGLLYYVTNYEVVETTETSETYETDLNTEDNGTISVGGDINNG